MDIALFIENTLKEAGKIAYEKFGIDGEFRTKADKGDYVTETDLRIHEFIVNQIKTTFPEDGIISEEDESNHRLIENATLSEKTYWILDPIDGTNNFATSIPLFGTMLCRAKKGEVQETGIYLPVFNEYYEAQKGAGAFLNKENITCSQKKHWKQTFGCSNANLSQKKVPLRNALANAWKESKFWLSAYGSAAVSGSYIAAGKRDWYMTMGSKMWDYAPLSLLLKESGCKVTNFQGEDWSLTDRSMIAANPALHKTLTNLIQ